MHLFSRIKNNFARRFSDFEECRSFSNDVMNLVDLIFILVINEGPRSSGNGRRWVTWFGNGTANNKRLPIEVLPVQQVPPKAAGETIAGAARRSAAFRHSVQANGRCLWRWKAISVRLLTGSSRVVCNRSGGHLFILIQMHCTYKSLSLMYR